MRVQGWDVILGEYLAARENEKFKYGRHDCCLFAAGAVKAITGIDAMIDVCYSNYRGAAKELVRRGGLEPAVQASMQRFGFPEIGVLLASRGDLALADLPEPCVGVVTTDGWNVVFAAPDGAVRVPLSACRKAWRIK